MVRKWSEPMDRAKYPGCYETPKDFDKTLEKAHKVMKDIESPDVFYNPAWYELLEKYPKLCGKIEELRMGVPGVEELNALKKQVEEQGLILQELWEHRVRGKPKE